jgi:hypothetical protein
METKEKSKAQETVVSKMKNGARLFMTDDTWIKKNAFFLNTDGTFERANVKVVKKLLEFKHINVLKQHGFLTVEFTIA